MMRFTRAVAMASAGCAAAAVALSAHDRITTRVTWDREISRIVEARCVSCHVEGGRAPMPLVTYEQARPWAKAIRDEVLARRMPKWHAARGYGDFANDPSLSPFEIGLIAAWADGGAPRGSAAATTTDQARRPSPAPPPAARATTLICGEQPLTGRLLAIRPAVDKGQAASVAALLPDGRREIIGWIRDFDPGFPTTYWLRTPLDLPPGSRILTHAGGSACALTVTLANMTN